MNLKHGDIITLENGDRVKVSLEKIEKPVTQLEVGKYYELEYTGLFCHGVSNKGSVTFDNLRSNIFQYIGNAFKGERDIFYSSQSNEYVMFGNKNLQHIIREIKK